jgi:plastocyanin
MLKIKLAAALAALVAVLGVAQLALAHPTAAHTTTVTVKASEFKFVLSRKSAPHGTVLFKVINKGHVKHDFKIAGKKTVTLKPGKSTSLKVRLKKGKFTYVCTIDSHAKLGMKGTFRAS